MIKFATDAFISWVEKDYWDIRSAKSEIHKNKIAIIKFEEYESLQQQNKIMKEALGFYGSKDNWMKSGQADSSEKLKVVADSEATEPFKLTGGKRARQALKQVEELRGGK